MIAIHQDSKWRYGAPKIHHLIVEEGDEENLMHIQRLMKKGLWILLIFIYFING